MLLIGHICWLLIIAGIYWVFDSLLVDYMPVFVGDMVTCMLLIGEGVINWLLIRCGLLISGCWCWLAIACW